MYHQWDRGNPSSLSDRFWRQYGQEYETEHKRRPGTCQHVQDLHHHIQLTLSSGASWNPFNNKAFNFPVLTLGVKSKSGSESLFGIQVDSECGSKPIISTPFESAAIFSFLRLPSSLPSISSSTKSLCWPGLILTGVRPLNMFSQVGQIKTLCASSFCCAW